MDTEVSDSDRIEIGSTLDTIRIQEYTLFAKPKIGTKANLTGPP